MKGVGYCSECVETQYNNYEIYKKIGAIEPPVDSSGTPMETQELKLSMVVDHNIVCGRQRTDLHELFNFFTLGYGAQAQRSNHIQLPNDIMYLIAGHLADGKNESPMPEQSDYRARLDKAMDSRQPVNGTQACMLCCKSYVNKPGFQHIIVPEGLQMCDACDFGQFLEDVPDFELVPPNSQYSGLHIGFTYENLKRMQYAAKMHVVRQERKRRHNGPAFNTRAQHKKRLRLE